MVLIIGSRHIKSRFRSKLSINSVPRSKQIDLFEESKNLFDTMSLTAVLGTLLIYSFAMFTLPFIAFFVTQHYMLNHYHFDRFTSNCFAVLAAVIVVNSIIAVYVYNAMKEPNEPVESDEPNDDQQVLDDKETHPKIE